jgi:hypothetical protein
MTIGTPSGFFSTVNDKLPSSFPKKTDVDWNYVIFKIPEFPAPKFFSNFCLFLKFSFLA